MTSANGNGRDTANQPTWQWMAKSLAGDCLDHLGVAVPPVPVALLLDDPPESLVGQFRVVCREPQFGPSIFVCTLRGDNTIFLDISCSEVERRVGLAEVLGQILLAVQFTEPSLHQIAGDFAPDFIRLFAYELLMPSAWLGTATQSWPCPETIARRFGVTPAFAVERLTALLGLEKVQQCMQLPQQTADCQKCEVTKAAVAVTRKKGTIAELRRTLRSAGVA